MWAPIFVDGIKSPYDVSSKGKVRNRLTGKILKLVQSYNGYLRVGLSVYDKATNKIVHKNFLVHRLVAFAFIFNPSPETKTTVNHIDGDKTNNNITNLEWATPSENTRHAYDTGLLVAQPARGEDSGMNKYPETTIRKVCELLEKGGMTNIEIARIANISPQMVYEIKIGNAWKHISKEYDIKPISRNHPTDFSDVRPLIKELLLRGYGYAELLELKPENVSKKSWNDMVYRIKKKLTKKMENR